MYCRCLKKRPMAATRPCRSNHCEGELMFKPMKVLELLLGVVYKKIVCRQRFFGTRKIQRHAFSVSPKFWRFVLRSFDQLRRAIFWTPHPLLARMYHAFSFARNVSTHAPPPTHLPSPRARPSQFLRKKLMSNFVFFALIFKDLSLCDQKWTVKC